MKLYAKLLLSLGLMAPTAALAQVPVTSGLRLYLRADVGVTNSSNPATDGGFVTDWADQSGNGNNATALGPAHRPTFVANAVNGQPAIRFSVFDASDPNGDVLQVAHDLSLNPAQITSFVVAKRSDPPVGGSTSDWQTIFIKSSSWSWSDGYGMTEPSGSSNRISFWVNQFSSIVSSTPTPLNTQYNLLMGSYDLDAVRLSVNGSPMVPTLFNTPIAHNVTPLLIGASPGPTTGFVDPDGFFNGEIAELILYGRALTPTEMASVQSYLTTKYAIGQDAPLPVELQRFTGTAADGRVSLSWTTATERDNAGFAVLRDGVEIAGYLTSPELRGHGTTATANPYQFIDSRVNLGQTYTYSLRSIDRSGASTSYPAAVRVTVTVPEATQPSAPTEFALSPASPNPFNPRTRLDLSLSEASTVTMTLYNVLGQPVRTALAGSPLAAGLTPVTIDADGLATGVYMVRVQAVGQSGRIYAATQRIALTR